MTSQNHVSKAAVSVSEMARQCGLSRQRFHQLRKQGYFPEPDYDPETGRPYYDEEKQIICLDVRKRNCGINGKPILFYARRSDAGTIRKQKSTASKPKASPHAAIIENLRALGLATITTSQVDAAVQAVFPDGIDGKDHAEAVRAVFLHLKSQGQASITRPITCGDNAQYQPNRGPEPSNSSQIDGDKA